MILGIDEVGRGPWAGPLVVGAVVLGGNQIDGLTDSKKLSKKRREELDVVIRHQASGYGLGWVSANEIDNIGLSAALVLATKRAVEQVTAAYSEIIIDGTVNFLAETNKGKYVTTLKKADLLIPSVSAASIIAKVARDNYMANQESAYPGYGFKSHVGYGTLLHRNAIDKLGITPIHRLTFEPLKKYATVKVVNQTTINQSLVNTKIIGDAAETITAKLLEKRGHQILERNWKTRFCEIDIVSKLDDTIFFTEVKYRKSSNQGGGLAAVTSKKLRQMKFAAEYYAVKNSVKNMNLRLSVASLSGTPAKLETILDIK